MRLPLLAFGSVLTLGLSLPGSARAVSATGLSSFEAIEEPLVKLYPAIGKFESDSFINITEVGSGTFRMSERYNAEWWDGDRDTTNTDRQRAEVKGLGAHQKHGETFLYTTTWRSNPEFRGSGGFCHLFQLKSTNGDSGAPLVTLSIHGNRATVEANRVGPKIIAREFPWKPATWQTVRIRIKTAPTTDGELMVSVDGDAFQGRSGIELSRPDANEYRPKWGLYRRAATGMTMGNDYVEHKAVSAEKIGVPAIENASLESAARERGVGSSPEKALGWLQSQPASAGRDYALGTLAALWAETDTAAAMTWSEAQESPGVRHDAVERVFSRWENRDITAAMKWLHTRAPNRELDELLWLLATDTTYRYVNRPIALDAAALIVQPELRAAAFDHVVLIWARHSADEAARFLAGTSALTADQKASILRKFRPAEHPPTGARRPSPASDSP